MTWMTTAQCDECLMVRTDPAEARWDVQIRLEDRGWWINDGTHLCPQCRRPTIVKGDAA